MQQNSIIYVSIDVEHLVSEARLLETYSLNASALCRRFTTLFYDL